MLTHFATQEVKIQGATGPLASLGKRNKAAVSDTEVGVGGTTSWRICALNKHTSVAVFFEVAATAAHGHGGSASHFVMQFATQYQHPSGQQRLRVCFLVPPQSCFFRDLDV